VFDDAASWPGGQRGRAARSEYSLSATTQCARRRVHRSVTRSESTCYPPDAGPVGGDQGLEMRPNVASGQLTSDQSKGILRPPAMHHVRFQLVKQPAEKGSVSLEKKQRPAATREGSRWKVAPSKENVLRCVPPGQRQRMCKINLFRRRQMRENPGSRHLRPMIMIVESSLLHR